MKRLPEPHATIHIICKSFCFTLAELRADKTSWRAADCRRELMRFLKAYGIPHSKIGRMLNVRPQTISNLNVRHRKRAA